MSLHRPANLAAGIFLGFAEDRSSCEGRARSHRGFFTALLIVLGVGLILPWCSTAQAQSQPPCGSKEYLDALVVPPPQQSGIKRQVQLINCSDQVVLGAATASHAEGAPGWPVFPQSGTWVMQKYTPGSTANVLTIDIPPEWYGQHVKGQTSNFWARTGCRYDPVTNRAQCETGGCGGQYDCSSANLGAPPGTSLAEWTFYQLSAGYYMDFPDISAVNGANLTIDVYPRGGDAMNPTSKTDFHWLAYNWPLTVHGEDLREPGRCQTATTGVFQLFRSDIDQTVSILPNYPLLGYVIVDGNGNPTMPPGNNVLACLSNCGKYKFPSELGKAGCNPATDENCYAWDTFCAGDPGITYGQMCNTDADCPQNTPGKDLHVACFLKYGPNKPGTCEIRAFYKGTVSQCNGHPDPQYAAPAFKVACNNTYASINPLDIGGANQYDYGDQPIVGSCSEVIFGGTNQPVACVGDDTLHSVLHGAYTWPNDPEVFGGDAPIYQIVFSPEGQGNAPITPAQSLPLCDSLPGNYMPSQNQTNCSISINDQYAEFGIGVVQNAGPQKWQSDGHDWPCSAGSQRGSGDNGVVCRWNPPPTNHCSLTDDGSDVCNCSPPLTDQYVTNSACGRIDSGTSLVSGSITTNSGDPLFLEVSIPCTTYTNGICANPVGLPASVSGCVPAQGMGAWSLLASQTVNSNVGIVAWYKGTSNTSVACTVTATTADSNPAELKIYDVPKFNGTVETMSTASGAYTIGPPADVSAGTATTTFSNDLQLGALLQANLTATPITYWENWLTNASTSGSDQLTCLMANTNCPRNDGTDYLPGHGAYSANSQVGHNLVTPGTQYFHRNSDVVTPDPMNKVLGSNFAWVGLAIYVELNPN